MVVKYTLTISLHATPTVLNIHSDNWCEETGLHIIFVLFMETQKYNVWKYTCPGSAYVSDQFAVKKTTLFYQ